MYAAFVRLDNRWYWMRGPEGNEAVRDCPIKSAQAARPVLT